VGIIGPPIAQDTEKFRFGEKVHGVVGFGMASQITVALEEKLSDQ
jgi:hypothetical protein